MITDIMLLLFISILILRCMNMEILCLTCRTPPFSSDEESSEEEETSEEEPPQTQKKSVLVNSTAVKAQTAKTEQRSTPHTPAVRYAAPVISADRTDVTTLSESDSEWTDGSEMKEINLSQLHKHTDQNGNVEKISHSKARF